MAVASVEGGPRVLYEEEVVLPGGSYIMRMLRGGQAKCTVLWCYITDWQSGRRRYLIPGRGMGKLSTPTEN